MPCRLSALLLTRAANQSPDSRQAKNTVSHMEQERESVDAEETMLCPSCLAQNNPGAMFCKECDAPLSASAVLDPIQQIRAQRFIFHRAATGPSSLFVVAGMWLLFLPIISVSVLLIYIELSFHRSSVESVIDLLLPISLGVLSVCLLWRVTGNFRKQRQIDRKNPNP